MHARQGMALAALVFAVAGCGLAQGAAVAVPRFVEESDASGLNGRFDGDWEYMVGGGVATFDCDDDGQPEVFLAGGTNQAALYRNLSLPGGALRFQAAPSGLELQGVTGAYPLNVDGDAHADLVLLRVGENVIMRGLGGCRFERANERWNFAGGDDWTTSFAATWERDQPWPTIVVGNYIDRTRTEFPWGSCTPNLLQRPGEGQRFAQALPLQPSFCALSMLFTDWNRSGESALRVSNDREYYKGGQEQLWRVSPLQPPRLYSEDDGWKPLQVWGMGIAAYDLTGDGLPEYYLTSMADNKLQTLKKGAAGPTFTDIAFKRGVTAHRPYTGGDIHPSTAWHTQFEDVNNDGFADLFVVKGNVSSMPDFAIKDPNNLLLGRPDGTFEEAGDRADVASFKRGRGGAVVDLNADGLLDLVVVNNGDAAQVWRNVGTGNARRPAALGRWLQLRLRQPGGNRDAIGAIVELRLGERTLSREVAVGGGHAGGSLGWTHFGLGDAASARLRVRWPHGEWSEWFELPADRFYDIHRDAGPAESTLRR